MNETTLFYLSDLFGVAVFAITGALMAGRKSMDIFGVLVVAFVTALGGGTLRDVILGRHPVSWIGDETYLTVVTLAALGTVLWVKMTRPIHELGLQVADAFGLAVFTVIGTQVALAHEVPTSAAVIFGVMTGVAGGVIRDMICNDIPLIFHKELYATPCILGSLTYIGLQPLALASYIEVLGAMAVVLAVRLGAIFFHWQLPRFHLLDRDEQQDL
ncbi:trimeric intracellular cation channel family protein [Atopomonas hussainii]|uniref:trimeric intracellular cation channel family protein n=1 Tax=Atopomonas hussainii TaxID=1429083 RepID=UPI0009F809FF|nr:trimeric intracellular cation channel family protein [Atopomonas hussainii]